MAERCIALKIAMIGHKLVPSRSGGIEVAVEALSTRMAAQGHDVTLYNRGKDPQIHNERYKGVHIRSVPVVKKQGVSAVMGSFLATMRAIFSGYDCIHFHAEGIAAMTVLSHLRRIPTVVTIHGLDWQRSKWGRFASWYLKLGERNAVRYADKIIVLSRAMQQYFLDTYGRETVYIPNGMPAPCHMEANLITAQWGLHKDDYILYLGRIVPEKGLENLIRSFSQVHTDKKLVIAGGNLDMPEHFDMLRELAKDDPRIIFTGFVQGDDLRELFSNCYFYCLPSFLEGMPISLLEALGFGNCCLSSDIPECAEVLGEWGCQFRCGSVDDLRDQLQMLCDHPEKVAECRRQVEEHFTHLTWDEVTEQTLDLYRSLRKDGKA